MKICVVLPSLGGGGAERLHINLINNWLHNGHEVELVVLTSSHQENSIEELVPKDCKLIFLRSRRIRSSLYRLIKHLQKNKYNIILAAMWPITIITIIAAKISFNKSKIFVSEHTVLSVSRSNELKVSEKLIRITSTIFYRLVDGLIAVSIGVKEDIVDLANLKRNRIKVIYNPAAVKLKIPSDREVQELREKLWKPHSEIRLLGVGSLKTQKGFDVLINAVNHLPPDLKKKCELIILGEGSKRAYLENLIDSFELNEHISLPGFQIDPYPWFFSADIFVLSSRWEGFGNVIVEALESGLSIVSTDCKSGPAEILDNGKYGELARIEDPEDLSRCIIKVINKKFDPNLLMARAQDFSVDRISKEYIKLFRER